MVVPGWGNTRHITPSKPEQDPVETLFIHCDVATDAYVVDIRNCLLCAVPVECHSGQGVGYGPR